MSEPIPLSSTLGVQRVGVVVCDTRGQGLDSVLESFPVECWFLGHI